MDLESNIVLAYINDALGTKMRNLDGTTVKISQFCLIPALRGCFDNLLR